MFNDAYQEVIEREIVLVRVFDASRETVFDAWTNPESICRWFGPKGFTIETRSIDVAEGGSWHFDMIAPDGHRFINRMTFLEIVRPSRLVLDVGSDIDDDPHQFRVTVTFDDQSDGKSVLTMRQLHVSPEWRAQAIGFGAVELGLQTLDKLAALLN
jgi:uncharacterized protein YndB with AHSA1/START domain